MSNYPLIKKWLGIECNVGITSDGVPIKFTVDADKLEAKLAEGFEVYESDGGLITRDEYEADKFVSIAIGKQPIKKQTQAEAALKLLQEMSRINEYENWYVQKAKKILEMKDE